jgi:hypothetical protein
MTGLVCFGPTGDAFVEGVIDTARKSQEENFDVLRGADIGRRFPQLRTDHDFKACFDHESGVLFADRALLATRVMISRQTDYTLFDARAILLFMNELFNFTEHHSSQLRYLLALLSLMPAKTLKWTGVQLAIICDRLWLSK